MRLGLIADDLTGAMDTGLQFSKHGLDTVVCMTCERIPEVSVVVINTDSREVRASEARERTLAAATLLANRRLYKKVDSTMRGNVGYELRALQEVLHPRAIVVAPAFPSSGRSTYWGVQRVHGQPLELAGFAQDPRWPMRESHLPTLLMQQSGREVGLVELAAVERGPQALAAALQACPQSIIVVDALTQTHLRTLAHALVSLGADWLPCGSAGLAEEWVAALTPPVAQRSRVPPANAGPVLIVSGSQHQVSRAQLSRACQERNLPQVDLDARYCYDETREVRRLVSECSRILAQGRDVAVTSSFAPILMGAGQLVSRILAQVTAELAERYALGGLFLTGGDIAVAVCRMLDVEALRISAEVQVGIPGGELVGGPWQGLPVVTKAGGFGDERAVLDALAYLHGEQCANSATT